ncbi:MAG: response regulator [Bacteroidetes bacterium]|nr:response regulator [Bacteroidota bacterium]
MDYLPNGLSKKIEKDHSFILYILRITANQVVLKMKHSGLQNHKGVLPGIQLKSTDEILHQKVLKIINRDISNPGLNVEIINLSISEVGHSRGFSNLSHFSNAFCEFYGISPTDYVPSPSGDKLDDSPN